MVKRAGLDTLSLSLAHGRTIYVPRNRNTCQDLKTIFGPGCSQPGMYESGDKAVLAARTKGRGKRTVVFINEASHEPIAGPHTPRVGKLVMAVQAYAQIVSPSELTSTGLDARLTTPFYTHRPSTSKRSKLADRCGELTVTSDTEGLNCHVAATALDFPAALKTAVDGLTACLPPVLDSKESNDPYQLGADVIGTERWQDVIDTWNNALDYAYGQKRHADPIEAAQFVLENLPDPALV